MAVFIRSLQRYRAKRTFHPCVIGMANGCCVNVGRAILLGRGPRAGLLKVEIG